MFTAIVAATAVLAFAACGGGGSSASGFCKKLQNLSVQFGGLQDNPSPALVQQAANAAQPLVASAPSAIKQAVKTQADAYGQWAKTGDASSTSSPTFSAANDQINAWTSSNCKQSS